MATNPIRIVIADDHTSYRSGLIATLCAEADMVVVGEGAAAIDAVSLALLRSPDIVLLDLNMPGNGITAATMIKLMRPATRSILLTPMADEDAISRAFRAGAAGYILKGISSRELVWRIREIASGGVCWPSAQDGWPANIYS